MNFEQAVETVFGVELRDRILLELNNANITYENIESRRYKTQAAIRKAGGDPQQYDYLMECLSANPFNEMTVFELLTYAFSQDYKEREAAALALSNREEYTILCNRYKHGEIFYPSLEDNYVLFESPYEEYVSPNALTLEQYFNLKILRQVLKAWNPYRGMYTSRPDTYGFDPLVLAQTEEGLVFLQALTVLYQYNEAPPQYTVAEINLQSRQVSGFIARAVELAGQSGFQLHEINVVVREGELEPRSPMTVVSQSSYSQPEVLYNAEPELNVSRLTGQQRKQIIEAIIDAFRTEFALEQALSYSDYDSYLNSVNRSTPLTFAHDLVKIAESQGQLGGVLLALRQQNRGNVKLANVVNSLM